MPTLTVRNVSKSFRNKNVLNPLTFDAGAGALVGVTGANGSGKTTLLKLLAGLVEPDAGDIALNGLPPGRAKPLLGFAPSSPDAFYERLTARMNLWFYVQCHGLPRAALEPVGRDWDLAPLLDIPVRSLSDGQKQRLTLARAFLHEPDFLFLDEPGQHLDAEHAARLWEILARERRNSKIVVITALSGDPAGLPFDKHIHL